MRGFTQNTQITQNPLMLLLIHIQLFFPYFFLLCGVSEGRYACDHLRRRSPAHLLIKPSACERQPIKRHLT